MNEAMSHHRSTLRRRAREVRAAGCNPGLGELPAVEPEVLEAVGRLSMRQRAVVVLRYWGDHTPQTIAEMLGISEGSVRRHLMGGDRPVVSGWEPSRRPVSTADSWSVDS